MIKWCLLLLVSNPLLFLSEYSSGVDKETLVLIIIILSVLLLAVLGFEFIKRFGKEMQDFCRGFSEKYNLKSRWRKIGFFTRKY